MSGPFNGSTRRVVAVMLGVLGVVLVISTTVIVCVHDANTDLSGVREVFLIIVGALLVLAGVSLATIKGHKTDSTQEPPP